MQTLSRRLSWDKITEHHNIDSKKPKNQHFLKNQLINKKIKACKAQK